MNRTIVRIGQAFSHDRPVISSRCLNFLLCIRAISTNSAIHRGISKSRNGGGRGAWPVPSNGSDGYRPGMPSWLGNTGSTRPRRPNHQQKQDVEDMDRLVNSREERMTPRQRQYLRGGPGAASASRKRNAIAVSSQRYSGPGRIIQDGRTRTSRYEGTRSPYGPSVPSNNMDHADRHALPDRYRQDRDLTLRDEQQLDAPRGRESSFDDRSTHFEQGSSADGAFRGRIYRKPSSSLTEDSTGQGGSFSQGQGRAGGRTYSPYGEVSGQDAKYGTSFSSGEYGAENGRYPYKHGPLSIPYTTPASQFLYGTSVVTAALRSSKRQLYKLYVYDSENREVLARDQSIRKLALLRDVAVTRLKEDGLSLLDKLSRGRPHNGYILEASPLPKLPVRDFQPVRGHQGVFHATLNHQSSEEEKVNGTESEVKYQSVFPRYPLVLMLDGILDPGNLGGILRTAYFFGVDAIAISNRNCAPFSPVTLKASAGAAENLNLMSIAQPRSFIDESQRNGWKFYAAVAPSSSTRSGGRRVTHFTTSTLACPVRDHPCVLMVGGEGEGLSWDLQKKADFVLGVEGNRIRPSGVDSLNVSVATGLLCEAFLRRPVPVHVDKKSSGTDKDSAGTDNADGGQRLF